jgi:hypothetical protein
MSIRYQPIADATETKRCTAINEALTALVRERFGCPLANSLSFPLGDNGKHICYHAACRALGIKMLAYRNEGRFVTSEQIEQIARSPVLRVSLSSFTTTTRSISPLRIPPRTVARPSLRRVFALPQDRARTATQQIPWRRQMLGSEPLEPRVIRPLGLVHLLRPEHSRQSCDSRT